ncbi:hypothetical protein B0H14DRAFT_3884948, partial [Mycena olivaceomarginata]
SCCGDWHCVCKQRTSYSSTHRTLPWAARGVYSQIPNLVRCEPVRSGGEPWSPGRAGTYPYLALCIVAAVPSLFGSTRGQTTLLQNIAPVIQAPPWARGSDRVGRF